MEEENNEPSKNEQEEKKKEGAISFKKDEEKQVVARDLVTLTPVRTKKQEVSEETKELAKMLKEQGLIQESEGELTNDEITILEAFMGKRLSETRILIIVNQTRNTLGIELLKKAGLEDLLSRLISKGYIDSFLGEDQKYYFLTEKGKEFVQ